MEKIQTALQLSRQVTDCTDWSEMLPRAIKEARDDKIGKYLENYKQMIERERQLEELESQTHMSSKYRRFLSYTNLTDTERQSEPEINSRLYKPAKGKVYLTSILKSRSEISSSDNKEAGFEVKSLNEALAQSYISKLVIKENDREISGRAFKKKEKVEVGLENVDLEGKEDDEIDFDKVMVRDLPAFDLSQYTLPKDQILRERAIDKIHTENLINIDKKLFELQNHEETQLITKILNTKRNPNVSEKFSSITDDLDEEFRAIEDLCEDLALNHDKLKQDEVDDSPIAIDTSVVEGLEGYSRYITTEMENIDRLQSELGKLIR